MFVSIILYQQDCFEFEINQKKKNLYLWYLMCFHSEWAVYSLHSSKWMQIDECDYRAFCQAATKLNLLFVSYNIDKHWFICTGMEELLKTELLWNSKHIWKQAFIPCLWKRCTLKYLSS